jgi:hypothetical protein
MHSDRRHIDESCLAIVASLATALQIVDRVFAAGVLGDDVIGDGRRRESVADGAVRNLAERIARQTHLAQSHPLAAARVAACVRAAALVVILYCFFIYLIDVERAVAARAQLPALCVLTYPACARWH